MDQRKSTLPALGAPYEGGKFAGITTGKDGVPYILVLLGNQFAGITLSWKDAKAWVAGLVEGADLPTRVEAALLFANLKSEFAADWYWTQDQAENNYVWFQDFQEGFQTSCHEDVELRARAILRVKFSPSAV